MTLKPAIDFNTLVTSNNGVSINFQSKMIDNLKQIFTKKEEQWYVANLYMYINYHPRNDFPINLENVYKMIGFATKSNAKRTIKNNFREGFDYKINISPREDIRTGPDTEEIMLNADTFKNLCMKAKTEKGKEIRTYYIKLEDILLKIGNEERLEYEVKIKELENKVQHHTLDLKQQKHDILLEKFKNKDCVYVIEIINADRKEDVIFEIKLGSTEDIHNRLKNHIKNYGKCTILDIFESDQFRQVEKHILNDPEISKNKATYPINGHVSREVVKLSNNFNYDQLLKIVKEYIKNGLFFVQKDMIESKRLDNEKIYLETANSLVNSGLNFEQLQQALSTLKQQVIQEPIIQQQVNQENQENQIEQEQLVVQEDGFQMKFRKAKGRKIQQIDPNNLQNIVKVYDSMTYLLREKERFGFYKQLIQNAIKDNTIYKGFRWMFVEKDDDPNIVHNIKDTVLKRGKVIEYILKINLDKTEIVNTFTGIKSIAKELQKDYRFIKKVVENNDIYLGFYYTRISQCPENLLETYTKPLKRYTKKVIQINPLTKTETIHASINEVSLKLGTAIETLLNAIKNKTIHNGSFWKFE